MPEELAIRITRDVLRHAGTFLLPKPGKWDSVSRKSFESTVKGFFVLDENLSKLVAEESGLRIDDPAWLRLSERDRKLLVAFGRDKPTPVKNVDIHFTRLSTEMKERMALEWASTSLTGEAARAAKEMFTDPKSLVMFIAITTVYVGLWLTPEPSGITKLAAGALTVVLLSQFAWHDIYGLAKAWVAFHDACQTASTKAELSYAGNRFLVEAGPRAFDIMLAIALWGLGKGTGKLAKIKGRPSGVGEAKAEPSNRTAQTQETAPESGTETSTVAAREATSDGHEIRVTEKGDVLVCSICKPLRMEYAEELADPANKALLEELNASEQMVDPEAKAKVDAGIRNRLEAARQSRQAPLVGQKGKVVVDPKNPGRNVTDIDKIEPNKLIEEKSATKAINRATGADQTQAWIQENITLKFARYLEARNYLPGFRNASIEFQFTEPGVDPAFRSAVEVEIARLKAAHPDVDLSVKWR